MNALETAARNFVVSPKAGRQLERHRLTVLMLRAKDAAFSQIQDLLAQHCVLVSESSITRFCRNHRAEIERLRLQLEQEYDLPSGSPSIPATAPTAPPLIHGRKCAISGDQFKFASLAMEAALRFQTAPGGCLYGAVWLRSAGLFCGGFLRPPP